ncbi:MAG: DNA-processing protein DprA [Lactobacillales bacterium]|jgi:DNA processing protein|nr:DNA-processing protein DprA [Lactobacillales bacterium]
MSKQKLDFYIFKLKCCGLANKNILRLLDAFEIYSYQDQRAIDALTARDLSDVTKHFHLNEPQKEKFKQKFRHVTDLEGTYLNFFEQHNYFTYYDEIYPEKLLTMYDPPVMLFYKGDLNLLDTPSISIVGARKILETTKFSFNALITPEITNHFTVVSGLALGVDTLAHTAAKHTIAVVANGLDKYFPTSNKPLQQYIEEKHLILSEYINTSLALKHHYHERNRIISALGTFGCVVFQAATQSGTIITAHNAMENGIDVLVVPGAAHLPAFHGSHELIRDGATIFYENDSLLENLTNSV